MPILEVKDLNVAYKGKKENKQILHNVSFSVRHGECLCVLGESGSGKSMTMKAVIGLLDTNFNVSGSAVLEGAELLGQSTETLRKIRGNKMTMILQNPMTCFDSLYRIDYQMKETLQAHTDWDDSRIRQTATAMLEKMKISNPAEVLRKYPHQLSGGMLQRIMIAVALTLKPQILVADEPTTAIDAITQFEIMQEFKRLKENHTTMLFITHDLGIASVIAYRIIVMNRGRIVDQGTFAEIMKNPRDEYTRLLIEKRSAVIGTYKKVLAGDTK